MGKWRRNRSKTRRWQRNHLIQRYGAVCFYDGLPFESMKDITFDHYIPVSKGGLDEIENYRLAHYRCNMLKGSMTPKEFTIFQKGGDNVE